MIGSTLRRIIGMDKVELAWRLRSRARATATRVGASLRRPSWQRHDLAPRITVASDLIATGAFGAAHRALSDHFAASTQRFPIARAHRTRLRREIVERFPGSADEARARADRVLAGRYDLLGYVGLQFDRDGHFDWQYDPVHDRSAPQRFWTAVPYLDPVVGDHKIIWELNRHQHWLALGRAYWLTDQAKYRNHCVAELSSWLEANPPLVGINWSSMLELAFRSLSWLWALHFFAEPDAGDSTPWTVDLLLALDRQLAHIAQNLSYYFSPNTHLTGEALALYVCGRALPELSASAGRERIGRQILVAEIDRQVCPDGGHCERSAHYQRYALDYYLLALIVARITADPIAPVFERAVERLAFAARVLADDHGRLPHWGDDDGGSLMGGLTGRPVDDIRDSLTMASVLTGRGDLRVAPVAEEATWLLSHPSFAASLSAHSSTGGSRSRIPSSALPDTGYYVSRTDDGSHIVIDGGPHGHLSGGHSHADALSLTCGVGGVPLLIDPGAGCYTADPHVRDQFRSTALHNTVTVDHRSQSVPGGPFRWRRTADATVTRWRTNEGFDFFDGRHDGYQPVAHRRRVLAIHRDVLIVADHIAGDGVHAAAVHWHIDPQWHVAPRADGCALRTGSTEVGLFTIGGTVDTFVGDRDPGLGWHSPVYGRIEPAPTVRISTERAAPLWMVSIFDLAGMDPVVAVERIPVLAQAGTLAHALAIRITRSSSTAYALMVEPGRDASGMWHVAEFETDACLLYCHLDHDRQLTRLALVDGSVVRSRGRSRLHLVLRKRAPHFHVHAPAGTRVALSGM